jgi:hypothetical protein
LELLSQGLHSRLEAIETKKLLPGRDAERRDKFHKIQTLVAHSRATLYRKAASTMAKAGNRNVAELYIARALKSATALSAKTEEHCVLQIVQVCCVRALDLRRLHARTQHTH